MGYVGPEVVKKLRSSYPDAILIGLDAGYFSNYLTTPKYFPECNLDVQYFLDIRNISNSLYKDILNDVDAIIHLAAISNDPIGNKFEDITIEINYHSSIRLAKIAKEYGVNKFIFASSCSIYGYAEDNVRNEKSPINPLTAYARSKVLMENKLEKLSDKNFIVTCLRFATACGYSDRLRLDLVLNDFVANAVASKKIIILSDGSPWRPLINVKDMARAIDWALNRSNGNDDNFISINIGSNEWNYQIKDLAYGVKAVIPEVDIIINQNAQPDKRSYKVDFSYFKSIAPNYYPIYDLKSTVNDLKEYLIESNFDDINFRESSLIRLRALSDMIDKGILNENLQWKFKL